MVSYSVICPQCKENIDWGLISAFDATELKNKHNKFTGHKAEVRVDEKPNKEYMIKSIIKQIKEAK